MLTYPDRTKSPYPDAWPQYPFNDIPPTREASLPKYSIVSWLDMRIPMRDGITLGVDVYRPFGPGEKFPALLAWSPYTKVMQASSVAEGTNEAGITEFWVPRGYVHVIVDARGTGDSQGVWDCMGPQEHRDMCDTIEWIAEQPWCDGNVGMIGISYFGIVQLLVAPQAPSALKAIFPYDGATDCYREFFSRGGVPQPFWYWLLGTIHHGTAGFGQRTPDPSGIVRHLQDHLDLKYPLYCSYWEERSSTPRLHEIRIPAYFGCHWSLQELHLRGACEAWELTGDIPKRMIIGPWPRPFRPFSFYHLEALRWYDHWLKGMDTGVMEGPPIQLYIPGDDRWRGEYEWPLRRTEWREMFLGGATGGQTGDLVDKPGKAGSRSYKFDPCSTAIYRGEPKLVYRSRPVDSDLEITGPIALYLHASVDTTDTDFHARILEEAPDGTCQFLCKGALRASHRELDQKRSKLWQPYHPHTDAEPLVPGEAYEFAIELWPTSNVFKRGHRIRLEISGTQPSSLEGIGRNRGGLFYLLPRPATVTVLDGQPHPSRVVLPVIPRR